MSNILSPSRFVIQSDWNLSLTDKFWAGLKGPGRPGVYCNLFPSDSNESAIQIESTDANFAAAYNRQQLSLLLENPATRYGTRFVAPFSIGANIHKKNVYSMDVAAGGLGVSSDSDGNMVVWETHSFLSRRSLKGHYGDVYSCKFFPSGLVVLSGGADMQLKIWSVETGQCARTLIGHRQAITDVGFVDRGRNVLSCSKDGTCCLWDCGSAACLATFNPNCGQINALCLVGGSKTTGPKSNDHELGTENKLLAVGCENGALVCFCMGDKSKIFDIKCDSTINACAFLDQNLLIGGSDKGSVSILDIRKPSCFLHSIKDDRGAVWSICVVEKGYWTSFGDGSVCYRSVADPSQNGVFAEMELSGPDCDPVYRVCTDGLNLYTCCRDAKIRKYLVH